MRFKPLVLIYGAGETATAVAHRLFRSRLRVILSAQDDPLTLLRGNAFSQALFTNAFEVEGVTARKAVVTEALSVIERGVIPLLTAESRSVLDVLNPDIVVDARPPDAAGSLTVGDASLVIGIGEGFCAGEDCDLVINTTPGHDMGRIIYKGPVPPPSEALPEFRKTLIASRGGLFIPRIRLGQKVDGGAPVASIGSEDIPAASSGIVSAILHEGVEIPPGTPVAEVDSRGDENICYTISDAGRLLSGGVLETAVAWVADVGGYQGPVAG